MLKNRLIKLFLITSIFMINAQTAKADVLVATHLLLNTLASSLLPDYESTSYHGSYITGTYGYRYEMGDAYKLGSETEGSSESSPGFGAGYQFLRSTSHKLAVTYDRKQANFQTENEVEGTDNIDSFGIRFNWGIFALKAGWSSHRFEKSTEAQYDGGAFTGIGFDIYMGRFSVYMDITDHYLEERKKHIAGGDFGFRVSFGDVN